MPFQIIHRCADRLTREEVPYAMIKMDRRVDGAKFTKIECPQCREHFLVMGHEMFDASKAVSPTEFMGQGRAV